MSKDIKAYKYARNVLEKLDELVINNKFSDEIELLSMNIKAKPFKDDNDLNPLCYRCSHHNPLLNSKGNDCTNCGQPFVFSFASFETLPLVEFLVADDINDEEALSLIEYLPTTATSQTNDRENKLRESGSLSARTNRMVISDEDLTSSSASSKDPFIALMNRYSVRFEILIVVVVVFILYSLSINFI